MLNDVMTVGLLVVKNYMFFIIILALFLLLSFQIPHSMRTTFNYIFRLLPKFLQKYLYSVLFNEKEFNSISIFILRSLCTLLIVSFVSLIFLKELPPSLVEISKLIAKLLSYFFLLLIILSTTAKITNNLSLKKIATSKKTLATETKITLLIVTVFTPLILIIVFLLRLII